MKKSGAFGIGAASGPAGRFAHSPDDDCPDAQSPDPAAAAWVSSRLGIISG